MELSIIPRGSQGHLEVKLVEFSIANISWSVSLYWVGTWHKWCGGYHTADHNTLYVNARNFFYCLSSYFQHASLWAMIKMMKIKSVFSCRLSVVKLFILFVKKCFQFNSLAFLSPLREYLWYFWKYAINNIVEAMVNLLFKFPQWNIWGDFFVPTMWLQLLLHSIMFWTT
mgnify:CR=1 FL=1